MESYALAQVIHGVIGECIGNVLDCILTCKSSFDMLWAFISLGKAPPISAELLCSISRSEVAGRCRCCIPYLVACRVPMCIQCGSGQVG